MFLFKLLILLFLLMVELMRKQQVPAHDDVDVCGVVDQVDLVPDAIAVLLDGLDDLLDDGGLLDDASGGEGVVGGDGGSDHGGGGGNGSDGGGSSVGGGGGVGSGGGEAVAGEAEAGVAGGGGEHDASLSEGEDSGEKSELEHVEWRTV